jgi:hydroxymethylpyrimidine pyrophosphatase-like HAD family hydrolase
LRIRSHIVFVRYLAFATDYDGTLAHQGRVTDETIDALERLRSSGRRTILVTGRELLDLKSVFPRLDLFDRVVAENGGLLYCPQTREERALGFPPLAAFVERLRTAGCSPLGVGRVIVATREPHEKIVLETIRAMGLELQVIFNKGAVMVLPSGVNKQTGLQAALDELDLSRHGTVAAGDAENDHAMLTDCECGVAVANALPSLKDHADFVTRGAAGQGIEELIARLLHDDLRTLLLRRHDVALGARSGGGEVSIPPYGKRVLMAGPPGSDKARAARSLLERLMANRYQCCIVDTEGDFSGIPGLVGVGTRAIPPDVEGILALLQRGGIQVSASLAAVPDDERPAFFLRLLAGLQELRARTGRPHWIVMDEVEKLLPATWVPDESTLPRELVGLLMMTRHPDRVSPAILASVDLVLAAGEDPAGMLMPFLHGETLDEPPLAQGELLTWSAGRVERLRLVVPEVSRTSQTRRAAPEDLKERAFVFRGREGKMQLRAQSLSLFLQMAEGVDDETWSYHLERGDVARWFREELRDDALADEITSIHADPLRSRTEVRDAIARRYALPE